jgi:RNA polymerase sigma-70 factor (ECF subfamily)
VERGLKQAKNRSAHSTASSPLADPAAEVEQIVIDQFDGERDSSEEELRVDERPDGSAQVLPPANAEEDEIVRRSLAGDPDAFESLVRRHSQRVFSIIGSFFRRRDMVEDIAQEVFAKAFFSLGTFTLGRSFEAWVARIAVNACYDHLRAQRRRIEQQMPRESETADDEWLEIQMLEAARARHLGEERQRDAAEIADRLLSKLDPEDRLVVVLMDRDGYSVREVSDMTGWGFSKVKVRAFRARRTLRAAMKRLVLSGERMQRKSK